MIQLKQASRNCWYVAGHPERTFRTRGGAYQAAVRAGLQVEAVSGRYRKRGGK